MRNLAPALLLLALISCGDDASATGDASADRSQPVESGPLPDGLPIAGNPAGGCDIPAEGRALDTSAPDRTVGDGTPESCTSAATVDAVSQGGVITFNCGPDPITIELEETLRIFNNTGPDIVIDGGGRVTLSGQGQRRILYMNTCDRDLVWTTPNCDDQDHPRLTVQNLDFVDGNAAAEDDGGGAIFARGGQLRIVNARFFRNRCADVGPDVGGAAVRAFDQYEDRALMVTGSTFGGAPALANVGSNGGALSSIGVSWTVLNSVLSYNEAVGNGGNPAQSGTPGGGSGGAIYNDGNTMTLHICGSVIEHNSVVQHGSAIFFVSNDRSGNIEIDDSRITNNTGGTWYEIAPQISGHPETGYRARRSTIE
ncbi:MAG: hypothetical protein AAF938_22315 [Myxococcota bacterium]